VQHGHFGTSTLTFMYTKHRGANVSLHTHLALASMKARSISWLQTSTRAMHFICSGTEGQ
jgi:hypothetical protein